MSVKSALKPVDFLYMLAVSVLGVMSYADCLGRIQAGNAAWPGSALLLPLGASLAIAAYTAALRGGKEPGIKAVTLVLLALIPEVWLWYSYVYMDYIEQAYIPVLPNAAFWIALCISAPFCKIGKISTRSFLIVFMLKGFLLSVFIRRGLLLAPWLIEALPYPGIIILLPQMFMPYYQLFILGVWVMHEEKMEKIEKNPE